MRKNIVIVFVLALLLITLTLSGCTPTIEISGVVTAVNGMGYRESGLPWMQHTDLATCVLFDDGRVYVFDGLPPTGQPIVIGKKNTFTIIAGQGAAHNTITNVSIEE